jgi:gliding motility-associated-like protein
LAGGNYTVVATRNSTNCSSTPVTITIIQTTKPTLTATVTANQTSCDPLQPNGSVTASAVGGSGDYTFEWFRGQNTSPGNLIGSTNAVTGLDVGKYTSKVTDNDSGCSAQAEVTITLNMGPTPVISATVVDQTQCTPFNGSITANISTGTVGDYTFSWYNGSTVKPTPDFTETSNVLGNLPAGTYTVKAIHSTNFCEAAPKTFTVLDLSPSITMTLNGSVLVFPSDCSSADGVMGIDVSAPGNTMGFTLEWFYGREPFSAPSIATETVASVSTVSNLIAGVYTIIATDLNTGCQRTQEFNLPFAEAHSLDFISKTDITKCVPDDDGDVTVKLNPSPLVAGAFDEGDYDIFVYAGTNDPGSSGTPVVPVIPGVPAQANYTTPATLTAQFYTFVAVSKKPGQFFGCRSIPLLVEIVNNTVNPVIASTSITPNSNCAGIAGNGQITASADGGDPLDYTFEWFNGTNESAPVLGTTGGVNGEQAVSLSAGYYTVRITNNLPTSTGCQSVAVFVVPNNPMPVEIAAGGLTTQDLMTCDPANGNVINNGSATVANISPGVLADYTFEWTDEVSTVLQSGASPTISNIGVGTFFVRATNAANCFTHLEFVINDQTIGSTTVNLIDFGSPERCVMPIDGFLTVNDDPANAYEWYAGTTPSGPVVNTTNDLQGIMIPPGQNSTTYTIKAIGANGCWGVDTYEVPLQVNEVIITASSSSPITNCLVDNGIVFGTVVNDNSLEYTYDWYIGTTVNASSDFTGKQVSDLGVGSYTVVATDMADAFCQSLPMTVILEDQRVTPPVAAAESSPLTNCDPLKANGSAAASVTGNIVNYTFDWYEGTTATGTPFFTGPVADGLLDGTYTVTATDKITGCTGTTQVVVTKNPAVVPDPDIVVISNVTSCIMPNGELSVSVGGNTKDYIFDWYNGGTVTATADYNGEIITGLDVGPYTVTATSRITGCTSGPATENIINSQVFPDFEFKIVPSSCDANNGSATLYLVNEVDVESIIWHANGGIVVGPNLYDVMAGVYDVTVTTIHGCATNVSIMIGTEIRPYNGVSRNDDGKNDIFYIDCIDHFPGNNVQIFNRAGTLVYESDGYDNSDTFFDGKSNKGISPMGVSLPDGTYYYIIDKRDGSKPLAGYVELVK